MTQTEMIEIIDAHTSYFRMQKLAELVMQKHHEGLPILYIAYMDRLVEVFPHRNDIVMVQNADEVIEVLNDAKLSRTRIIAIILTADDPNDQIQQTINLLCQCMAIHPLGIVIESVTTIRRDVDSPRSQILAILSRLYRNGVWIAYTTSESVKRGNRWSHITSLPISERKT